MFHRTGALTCAALTMAVPGLARADDATTPGAGLQEIVVTAQKRSENLQRVPIAVTAITAATLARSGIQSTQDLGFAVPSLVYSRSGSYAQPFLRGVGSDQTQPNSDPSVATYVDGVFVSTSADIIQQLLGVERVEVLEGPQGTLYGRNAVAGAINIYTLTPGQSFSTDLKATAGNYGLHELSGYVSGPITSTLSVGLYAGLSHRDTYYHFVDPLPPGQPDDEFSRAIRGKAVWRPTDRLALTASVEYDRQTSAEAGLFRNIQPDALGYAFGAPVVIAPYTVETDTGGWLQSRTFSASLREEYDLGWARILGISAFRDFHLDSSPNDLDGTDLPLLHVDSREFSQQVSQELQLLSREGSPIKWIAGLYYFHEHTGFDPVMQDSALLFGPTIGGNYEDSTVDTASYAVFGQVTAPLAFLAPGLDLTLGGRFTHDHKDFSADSYYVDQTMTPIPGTYTTYAPSQKGWSNFSPKVTLNYKFGTAMAYATFSQGFKAGVYNMTSPGNPGPVNPEKLTDYEVGLKAELFDHRLRLNSSAYYYDYTDIQVSQVGAGLTTLQNAAAAWLYGIETTATARITRDVSLNATGAFSRSRYTNFVDAAGYVIGPAGNASAAFNATGNTLLRAPKWTGSASLAYDHANADQSGFHALAAVSYNGGFFWDATNQYRQSAYALVNASIGYTIPGGHLTMTLYGRNLGNRFYETGLVALPTSVVVQDAAPRMYGVSVETKF
jgi:iron complex outermembrane recepter protein